MRSFLVGGAIVLVMLGSAMLLGPREPAPPLPPSLGGTGEWLPRAQQIDRLRLPIMVAGLALPPLALWIFVATGRSARLRRRLVEAGVRNQWLLVGLFSLILGAGLLLLQLPLDAASYLVRRAYGLSAEPAVDWLLRELAEATVAGLPLILAVEGLYWLLRRFPGRWWVYASLGYMLFSFAAVYLQPLLVTPLFFDERPLEDPALRARIMQMGARVGTPIEGIYVIDASRQGAEGNAYFTGIGAATRIVLYDTLLRDYSPDELLAILGHEMGHWYARHIWKGLLLSWIAAPFGFFAAQKILRWSLPRWGIRSPFDIAGLPFLLLLLNLVLLATLPIQNWQSRRWEAEADRFAVRTTGNPQGLARALAHLARQNLSDPAPAPLLEALFATHPAIGRRIAALPAGPSGLDAPIAKVYDPSREVSRAAMSLNLVQTALTERPRP